MPGEAERLCGLVRRSILGFWGGLNPSSPLVTDLFFQACHIFGSFGLFPDSPGSALTRLLDPWKQSFACEFWRVVGLVSYLQIFPLWSFQGYWTPDLSNLIHRDDYYILAILLLSCAYRRAWWRLNILSRFRCQSSPGIEDIQTLSDSHIKRKTRRPSR